MKTAEEFKQFYTQELTGTLNDLEVERKKGTRLVTWLVLTIMVGSVLIALPPMMEMEPGLMIVGGVLTVAGIIFWAIKINRISKAIKLKFKEEVIRELVHFVDSSLNYDARACISQGEFSGSKIFVQGIDRYKGDDLVYGTIGKTDVRFSELNVEYATRDSKGNKQYHTLFKGIFFIADFHKNFVGETVVVPDTAEKLFGKLGTMLQKMNISRADLVKMENPEFEKAFAVYGTDQVEARYILTPALMQRIMDFKKKSGKIHLSFLHSKVYLAISVSKNLFEPPFFQSMLRYELVEDYFNYLILSVNIVEDLDLNTRIWTKE
jgi:hypothetical protein